MVTIRENIITGITWPGAIAGLIIGLITHLALMMIGIGVGGFAAGPGMMSEVAWGALIWLIACAAISAFVAGYFASRVAPGLTTKRAGACTGLLTGALLLITLTYFTVSSAASIVGTAFNAAGQVLGVPDVSLEQPARALGLEEEFRMLSQGIERADVERLIAEASPELERPQVSAATGVVMSVFETARRRFVGSLTDVSRIGEVANQQADFVYQQLTGPEFVQNLQAQGLSPQQAQEVSGVVNARAQQLQQQVRETADSVQQQLTEWSERAAETVANAAWGWLIMAAIILGLATLGGTQGSDEEAIEDRREEEMHEEEMHEEEMRQREERERIHHHH